MLKPPLVGDCVRRMRDAVQVPSRSNAGSESMHATTMSFSPGSSKRLPPRACRHSSSTRGSRFWAPLAEGEPGDSPLKYQHVQRLKRDYPDLPIVINGGLNDVRGGAAQLDHGLDGVMLGRAAYHRPQVLSEIEAAVLGTGWVVPEPRDIVERIVRYARTQAARGVRLHSITRHMHV